MQGQTLIAAAARLLVGAAFASSALAAQAATLTIATLNNPDMIELKKLSPAFEKANPDIKLNWVILEENVLRQRATTDITTGSGQFDVMAIGTYEAPQWGKRGWLSPMTGLPADYDLNDVVKTARDSLSYNGQLYALPFYVESSMTYYRKDLFAAKGLKMPDQPTYDQIAQFADKLTDKANGTYGICLRGKAGWGENMAYVSTVVNTFGGRWFDENWNAQLTSPEWKKAITFYVDLLKKDGPPGSELERLQREPDADRLGQVRDVDRRDGGRRHALQQAAVAGGRQDRLRGRAGGGHAEGLALAVGLGAGDPEDLQAAGRGQEVHHLGDLQAVRRDGRQGRGLGLGAAGHAPVDLRACRVQGRRAVLGLRAEGHRDRRRQRSLAEEGAVHGRPVRRDS